MFNQNGLNLNNYIVTKSSATKKFSGTLVKIREDILNPDIKLIGNRLNFISPLDIDNVSISSGDAILSNPVTLTYENNQRIIKLTDQNPGTCILTVTQKTTNTIAETTLKWGWVAMRQD